MRIQNIYVEERREEKKKEVTTQFNLLFGDIKRE